MGSLLPNPSAFMNDSCWSVLEKHGKSQIFSPAATEKRQSCLNCTVLTGLQWTPSWVIHFHKALTVSLHLYYVPSILQARFLVIFLFNCVISLLLLKTEMRESFILVFQLHKITGNLFSHGASHMSRKVQNILCDSPGLGFFPAASFHMTHSP